MKHFHPFNVITLYFFPAHPHPCTTASINLCTRSRKQIDHTQCWLTSTHTNILHIKFCVTCQSSRLESKTHPIPLFLFLFLLPFLLLLISLLKTPKEFHSRRLQFPIRRLPVLPNKNKGFHEVNAISFSHSLGSCFSPIRTRALAQPHVDTAISSTFTGAINLVRSLHQIACDKSKCTEYKYVKDDLRVGKLKYFGLRNNRFRFIFIAFIPFYTFVYEMESS